MPTLLKDLTIEEISSVDKGANPGARVLLMKRHAKEGNPSMSSSTIVIKNAEAVVAYGIPPAFPKSYYIGEIQKRASEIRAAGDSDAKAFTKAITDDPIGRTLYKASKTADGPEIETDAPQDDVKPASQPLGPAGRQMQALADLHLKAHPELAERRGVKDGGKAAAYAAAYMHPSNTALREQVKAEHLAHALGKDLPSDTDDEHKAPRELQQDAVEDQRQSNAFADRQAGKYPGNRGDIKGPRLMKPLEERNRLVKIIDGALSQLVE